ncbi:3-hydroxyacyl-CoA dehydrogenase NAD-binding domain-containing protein [Streptomyces lasalocidi]
MPYGTASWSSRRRGTPWPGRVHRQLVVETVIENLDATTEVLTALDTIVGDPAAELATNTSALPVRRTVRGRCRVRAVLRMKEAPCPPKITNGVTVWGPEARQRAPEPVSCPSGLAPRLRRRASRRPLRPASSDSLGVTANLLGLTARSRCCNDSRTAL